jgi:hypothetical protein
MRRSNMEKRISASIADVPDWQHSDASARIGQGLDCAHQMIAIELVDRLGKPEEISEVVL